MSAQNNIKPVLATRTAELSLNAGRKKPNITRMTEMSRIFRISRGSRMRTTLLQGLELLRLWLRKNLRINFLSYFVGLLCLESSVAEYYSLIVCAHVHNQLIHIITPHRILHILLKQTIPVLPIYRIHIC
jgi:hypothetical protein